MLFKHNSNAFNNLNTKTSSCVVNVNSDVTENIQIEREAVSDESCNEKSIHAQTQQPPAPTAVVEKRRGRTQRTE